MMLIAASLLGGVTFVLCPLLPLGVDQVAKIQGKENLVAFQADDLEENAANDVCMQLRSLYRQEHLHKLPRVIVFVSPQALCDPEQPWNSLGINNI